MRVYVERFFSVLGDWHNRPHYGILRSKTPIDSSTVKSGGSVLTYDGIHGEDGEATNWSEYFKDYVTTGYEFPGACEEMEDNIVWD